MEEHILKQKQKADEVIERAKGKGDLTTVRELITLSQAVAVSELCSELLEVLHGVRC